MVVAPLRTIRLGQIRRLSNQRCNDSVLLDEYKLFKHLSTDMALADIFELGRNSISMVRNGRNSLGERPRLIIFQDAFEVDISKPMKALDSSKTMISLINEHS